MRRSVVSRAAFILRDEGFRPLLARVFSKLSRNLDPRVVVRSLVPTEDAGRVDWTKPIRAVTSPITVREGSARVAWITSLPGPESGGHQNIWRFVDFLERAGHRSTIYLHNPFGRSMSDVQSMLASNSAYPELRADIVRYDPDRGVAGDIQAIFATGWETAYPSFMDPSPARRFYFVQDFEPSFYPTGSEAVLAENTYRFGFHGITAGGWLARKLHDDYGMTTDFFDFAVDRSVYFPIDGASHSEVFFYARPVTPRRAFEFGLLALNEFHKMHPEVTINLVGWDLSPWRIPFRHQKFPSLDISQLNDIYNRCAAGLVISLTNMSLLPLELISAGVTPVVNDGPNNRLVVDNEHIEWVPLSPAAVARKLSEIITRSDNIERAKIMSRSVGAVDWTSSGRQFVSAFERVIRG